MPRAYRASGVTPLSGVRNHPYNDAVSISKVAIEERYYDSIREHPEISEEDVRIIAGANAQAQRILDIGCGAGGFLVACQRELGVAGIGMDSSLVAARLCRANGLVAFQADATRLPIASESLDVVRAKEIIEHIVDLKPFMVEVYRVLKPGGLFLSRTPTPMSILYPIGNFYDDYTHIRPLSRAGLEHLLTDAHFQIEHVRGYTAGRNGLERALGRLLGRVFPHAWLALARKPVTAAI
jgi:SAM-dependent methyltransferase